MFKILVINPGSTSTKVSYFEDEKEIKTKKIEHQIEELKKFERIFDQYEFRKNAVLDFLKENNIDEKELSCVVGRGGVLRPISAGTYIINEKMLEDLRNASIEHASNLGAPIAYEIAKPYSIPAYIVADVVVDEFPDIARISGLKEIQRKSRFHALNTRYVAQKRAEMLGGKFKDFNFIVAHIGGGISVVAFEKGRAIDVNDPSSSGPFSPERPGGLPSIDIVEMCYSGKYTKEKIKKLLMGEGGIVSYLGTNDLREVERMIDEGNEYAKLIYEAMAYQISKDIVANAVVLKGDVDEIILTGGASKSLKLTNLIKDRVYFVSNIFIFPGEMEQEALCYGALNVLRGEEKPKDY
ncbi:MAG: butyrate kinase [Caldisericia bacterium]|nr:butyrate kinase [Caldisericia bacterium]